MNNPIVKQNYTLINDNCFNIKKYLQDGEQVDHIICDPPYNINIDTWDNNFDIAELAKLSNELVKDTGNVIIFSGWSNVEETLLHFKKYFILHNWIIYDRIKGRGASKNLVSTREDILWFSKSKEPIFHKMYSEIPKKTTGMGEKNGQENRALTNVWSDISSIVPWSPERKELLIDGKGHPSQKPIGLMERCIKLWTNPGDTVLDFTMGTGTTGDAAIHLNRKFIGIEQDTGWFNIASNRLSSDLTQDDLTKEDIIEDYNF